MADPDDPVAHNPPQTLEKPVVKKKKGHPIDRESREPITEGQRRFQALTARESYEEIGARLGASKPVVGQWWQGEKRPGPAFAQRIEQIYGIPVEAWRAVPRAGNDAPTPPPRATNGRTPSVLDDCLDVLKGIREQRQRPDLLNSERVKLADTEARILALRAKLEADAELKEDRVVRTHPGWHSLRDTIVEALKPYPEALAAVVAALGGKP